MSCSWWWVTHTVEDVFLFVMFQQLWTTHWHSVSRTTLQEMHSGMMLRPVRTPFYTVTVCEKCVMISQHLRTFRVFLLVDRVCRSYFERSFANSGRFCQKYWKLARDFNLEILVTENGSAENAGILGRFSLHLWLVWHSVCRCWANMLICDL